MKKKYLDFLILKLLSRYEYLKEQKRQEHYSRVATLASTAKVCAEGDIENYFGDSRAVVIGENSYLRGRLIIYGHGGRISIGDWCYIADRLTCCSRAWGARRRGRRRSAV